MMSTNLELDGEVALVTGAGRGIGKAVAEMLAGAGAHVVCAARTETEIAATADSICAAGGKASHYPCDVSKEKQVTEMFQRVRKKLRRVDILVNNAGLGIFGELSQFKTDDFERLVDVNLRGTFLACREAMQIMTKQKSGYIINVSSVMGFRGYENQSIYAAAKHGVMGMTKSLAVEAQEHGIRVSAILPGGVDTDMAHQARPDLDPSILMQPEDIAQAVEYLLSLSDRAAVDQIYVRRRGSKPF